MLRIVQNSRPADAKSYFHTADYYAADHAQELVGEWGGRGAARLGLKGTVRREDFEKLCDNLDPRTGESLTQRNRGDRTAGYDFNFNGPKGLSLIYGLYRDPEILEAFRASVRETMEDVEKDMMVRVRKGGRQENRTSGNMVWSEFVHFTARPVGGVPDAALHSHMFAFNASRDPVENIWKAGQFRQLKKEAGYYESLFHARLAKRIKGLGYGVVRRGKFWDMAGITPELIAKFSKRMRQIDAKAKEKGVTDTKQRSELAAKTREKKCTEFTSEELRNLWWGQMSDSERGALAAVQLRDGRFVGDAAVSAEAAMAHAVLHSFERSSVVSEKVLLAEALRHGVGSVEVGRVYDELNGHGIMSRDHDGERLVTTREVLGEEQQLLRFAREGRGVCRPLAPEHEITRDWLDTEQKSAVEHILKSTDRVILVRGIAGTGKTTLTKEAVAGIEAKGRSVVMVAPTAQAARGVLREKEGFAEADTLQRLLIDRQAQANLQDGVLWIDEAGLVGSRDLARAFEIAQARNARVVLMGDTSQHRAVNRGNAMRLLEEQAGIQAIEVRNIRRQKGKYRSAVAAFASGDAIDGLTIIKDLGWVHEGEGSEQHQQLARDYARAARRGEDVLVACPTHFEAGKVQSAIRNELRREGLMGEAEQSFLKLLPTHWTEAQRADAANYRDDDSLMVQFVQNARGFARGERVKVKSASDRSVRVEKEDGKAADLPLDQVRRFAVFRSGVLAVSAGDRLRITKNATVDGHSLNNGAVYGVAALTPTGLRLENGWTLPADFGFLDGGFVVTSVSAQGRTHDRVMVAASGDSIGAINQAQTYVSASRGRHRVDIYTDEFDALKREATKADRPMTAMELVQNESAQSINWRDHVAHLQRLAVRARDYASRTVDTALKQVKEYFASQDYAHGQ